MTTLGPFESVTVNISTHFTTEIKALKNELDVTLGVITVNLARVVLVADGLADFVEGNSKTLDSALRQVEAGVSDVPSLSDAPPVSDVPLTSPVSLTPPVPPVDLAVTHTLMMRQYNEMRRVIASEHEKTRWFTAQCTMVVLFFVVGQFLLNYVHSLWTPVCAMAPPVPPVCAPVRDTSLPDFNVWLNDWFNE